MSKRPPLIPAWLPDDEELESALTSALRSIGCDETRVKLVGRELNVYASSSPSEILSCRLDDGRKLELLCKYPRPGLAHDDGHRGGTTYEATVYRVVLAPLRCSTPGFRGAHVNPADGGTWLFLEYLGPCLRVDQSPHPRMMERAAEWIARFHTLNERRLDDAAMDEIAQYDADYYAGWSRRTSTRTAQGHDEPSWLPTLCRKFETFAAILLEPPRTIIHGEYYPINVRARDDTIHPVDWESAARAAGELDLAALIELWDETTVDACVRAYADTRWPTGPPADFERRLAAGRMYLLLRWLGDPSLEQARTQERLELLRELGRTWGLF